MCGRYTLARSQQELSERYGIQQLFIDVVARYNIAPTQKVPVVLNLNGEIALDAYQWGLIPSWTKDLKSAKLLINARAETLMEKPSFKTALLKRRCLVPADGFYEWKKAGALKTPMFIHQTDNELFSFAGIWDEWKNSEGVPVRTFSIITTEANESMAPVHDRMPVILPREAEAKWLDPKLTDPGQLMPFLRPCPSNLISMYEVSPEVNSVKTDSAKLIEPAEPSGGQLTLKLF